MKRFLRLPSPSMVVAIAALCVALAGGAYAATKIGTKQIQKGAVTGSKLAKAQRSQGFVFFDGAGISLGAGDTTHVAELTLPDGNFFVTAQVGVDADVASDEGVECRIQDDGAIVSTAITALPNDGPIRTGTLTLTGPVTGGTIALVCIPDNASSARHRMITAIRVGSLVSQ